MILNINIFGIIWFSIFLVKIIIVLLFSHILINFTILNFLKKRLFYIFIYIVSPNLIYFDLVIEVDKIYYFLLYQNTIILLIKI